MILGRYLLEVSFTKFGNGFLKFGEDLLVYLRFFCLYMLCPLDVDKYLGRYLHIHTSISKSGPCFKIFSLSSLSLIRLRRNEDCVVQKLN